MGSVELLIKEGGADWGVPFRSKVGVIPIILGSVVLLCRSGSELFFLRVARREECFFFCLDVTDDDDVVELRAELFSDWNF
jgi:hypothetical protein